VATKLALKMSDYVITECGFGSDLGFEKYVDLVSGFARFKIHAVVIVATVRALKHQGGGENSAALTTGLANLGKHINNIQSYGFAPIVAINVFPGDRAADLDLIKKFCQQQNVAVELSEAFTYGGEGSKELAKKVIQAADESKGTFKPVYSARDTVEEKIVKVAENIYGADGVIFSWEAKKKLKLLK
jgi:formate--tetrahydrofolate ligase